MNRQSADGLSVWEFRKRALRDRKDHGDVFIYGKFEPVEVDSEISFAFVRIGGMGGKWLAVLHFSGNICNSTTPGKGSGSHSKGRVKNSLSGTIELKAWKGYFVPIRGIDEIFKVWHLIL